METRTASAEMSSELLALVQRIRSVRLYFAARSRNAWYANKSVRYFDRAIHTQCASAQRYCEEQRVQGSQFVVRDLPGIAFEAGSKALLVTQINTPEPLAQANRNLLTTVARELSVSRFTLQQVYLLFRAESRLWPVGFRKVDSVIQVLCEDSTTLCEFAPDTPLVARHSESRGVNFALGWRETAASVKSDALLAIADELVASCKRLQN